MSGENHEEKYQYQLIVGKGLKLVPLSCLPEPEGPEAPPQDNVENSQFPSEVTGVYVTLDCQASEGENATPRTDKAPDILCLEQLTDRGIQNIAANPSGICAITKNKELLMAKTMITDERNGNVQFTTQSSFDLFEVLHADCGAEHTVVLAMQGHQFIVLGAGSNQYGQIGCGNIEYSQRFKPVRFSSPQRFVQACCGAFFTLLLSDIADVWVFGSNNHGQLGIDGVQLVKTPTLCSGLTGVPVCCLAAGTNHTLALSTTGIVFGTGSNIQGQLAFASPNDVTQFTILEALSNVFIVHVAAYGTASAAIDEFGTIYLWGGKWGSSPNAMTFDTNCSSQDRFVDIALGNEGRFAALTSHNKLFVSGYFLESGEQMRIPVEVRCPVLPFYRVFSGGEYFIVLAGANQQLPLINQQMNFGKSLLPPSPSPIKDKLRPPQKIMNVSVGNFQQIIVSPVAGQIIRLVFSSLGSINASFLIDNFSETMSNISSGIDIAGVVQAYDLLFKSKDLLLILTASFNRLIVSILEKPPSIRRPTTIRFLMTGLLMPSPLDFRESYDFWFNLITLISKMNVSSILAQWLSVVTPEQLRRILYSLKDFLSCLISDSTKNLYSPISTSTVSVLEIVWFASTRSRKLAFDDFYHVILNKVIDIQIEFQMYVMPGDNWCFCKKSPWLLNANTKTRFVRLNSKQMMNQRQMSAMANAQQFWGTVPVVTPLDLFLVLQVDRNNLLRDTFLQISALKNPDLDLKKPLKIVFKDEPGVDEGGVQREFFELIVNELLDTTKGFFIQTDAFNWFNPDAKDPAALQAFLLAGIVLGLAIYNGNLINIKFPIVVYKKLRGLAITLNDMKEFDSQLMTTLENVLHYEGDVENDMCLDFEYNGFPLIPDGSNVPVTNENREQYVEAVANYILNISIREQFEVFKQGFLQSAGSIVLDLFRPEELALLVAGREELDFVALQKVTKYEGYTEQSESVKIFWKIVHNRLTDTEKKKLLYFVTSTPRAPINGLGSIPFVIARDGEASHIPTSHTCFFMLVLPDDPDEERMYKKLQIAISNAEGFAFK